MTSEWPRVSLRGFADLLAGFAFKSSGYTENSQDVRLLRGDNIAPGRVRWDGVKRWPKICGVDLARYALQPGDVVLAMDRPWIPAGLKVAQITEIDTPSYLVQRVARLRAGSGADCDFLFSLLSTPEFESYIQNATTGTAVPHISAKQILDYEFRLPPASVRAEVGALLAAINNRITLLRETNTTLEAIAQALFKSWFVDFDPVHAKLQGRAPEGMIEATAALFPDNFDESELGTVPKGWQVMSIGDAVEAVGGATPETKTPEYWEPADHHWTTPKDLSGIASPVLLSTERKLSDAGLKKISSGLLPVGSLLMSSRAPIGYLALTQVPIAINQGYIAIPPGGRLSPLFMLFWCQTNMDSIKGRANGSTFMEISKKAFRPIPALVPNPAVLDAFDSVAVQLFARLVENEKQAQSLVSIRDTLLPRLISGQLQLPDAQKNFEEAL
jgi:type I restriction enzyme S subunit